MPEAAGVLIPDLRTYDRMVAATRELEQQLKNLLDQPRGKPGYQPLWESFKNESGEVIPPYSVIRLGVSELTSVSPASIRLKGYKPSTTFSRRNAVTEGREVAIGGYGLCCREMRWAKWDTGTPVEGDTYGPKPGQWTLAKYYPGFVVEGIIDASAKIALVRPEPITQLLGKTDASHAKGATGVVSIYVGAQGSESDTTINVSAWNKFATLAITKWCWLSWGNNGWYITAGEC